MDIFKFLDFRYLIVSKHIHHNTSYYFKTMRKKYKIIREQNSWFEFRKLPIAFV